MAVNKLFERWLPLIEKRLEKINNVLSIFSIFDITEISDTSIVIFRMKNTIHITIMNAGYVFELTVSFICSPFSSSFIRMKHSYSFLYLKIPSAIK